MFAIILERDLVTVNVARIGGKMSIHKSLKPTKIKFRSVRKRWERLKELLEKGKKAQIYAQPKEKRIKLKEKKAKEEESTETSVKP